MVPKPAENEARDDGKKVALLSWVVAAWVLVDAAAIGPLPPLAHSHTSLVIHEMDIAAVLTVFEATPACSNGRDNEVQTSLQGRAVNGKGYRYGYAIGHSEYGGNVGESFPHGYGGYGSYAPAYGSPFYNYYYPNGYNKPYYVYYP
ncbi:hypothetical protein AAG570_010922 [Ranatra chinensis]|uniref:Uncharacterized protein n=1 Tax=Ranatra chinensis TaxID=642074 RepID=A0ABD0YJF0_9HEMI